MEMCAIDILTWSSSGGKNAAESGDTFPPSPLEPRTIITIDQRNCSIK